MSDAPWQVWSVQLKPVKGREGSPGDSGGLPAGSMSDRDLTYGRYSGGPGAGGSAHGSSTGRSPSSDAGLLSHSNRAMTGGEHQRQLSWQGNPMLGSREPQRSPFTPASSVSPAGSVRVHEDSSPVAVTAESIFAWEREGGAMMPRAGVPARGPQGGGLPKGGGGLGKGAGTIAALDFPGLLVPPKPAGKLPGRPDGTSPGMSASPTPFFPPADSIQEEEPADVDPPLVDADLDMSLTWEEVASAVAQEGPLDPSLGASGYTPPMPVAWSKPGSFPSRFLSSAKGLEYGRAFHASCGNLPEAMPAIRPSRLGICPGAAVQKSSDVSLFTLVGSLSTSAAGPGRGEGEAEGTGEAEGGGGEEEEEEEEKEEGGAGGAWEEEEEEVDERAVTAAIQEAHACFQNDAVSERSLRRTCVLGLSPPGPACAGTLSLSSHRLMPSLPCGEGMKAAP